jgi:hypothetical protein
LGLSPPQPNSRAVIDCGKARVQRRDRLGGLIREYTITA